MIVLLTLSLVCIFIFINLSVLSQNDFIYKTINKYDKYDNGWIISSIDIKDDTLKELDYVIAGIHSNFKMEKTKMTERMIKAMKNPHVDIISHPTGRILKRRDEYQIDFGKILRVARETKTILEINSYPERLDLNDQNIRRAKEAKVKMVINTDSHQKDQLRFMEFGIAQARRGWAEKEDIINCWSLEKLLKYFE